METAIDVVMVIASIGVVCALAGWLINRKRKADEMHVKSSGPVQEKRGPKLHDDK